MRNLFFYLIFILVVFWGCSDEARNPEENITETKTEESEIEGNTQIEIKEEVVNEIDSTLIVNVESKDFIKPKKLFDYYPEKYKELELIKNSNGLSSSGLGKYTTSTGVMQSGETYLRLRLSDYFDTKYIPEYNKFVNTPESDANFEYYPIKKDNYYGYLQWHKFSDLGVVNVIISNRFNLFIEIDGYSELKNSYNDLIEKFELKKLKEIKDSNG